MSIRFASDPLYGRIPNRYTAVSLSLSLSLSIPPGAAERCPRVAQIALDLLRFTQQGVLQ